MLVLIIYCDDNFEECTFGNHQAKMFLGRPCDDSLSTEPPENRIPYVGDDFNDNFESFTGHNNCWAKVFEHADFGGASTPFASRQGNLGALNDEGSSVLLQ
jgi:hypothetical protein